MTNKGSLHHDTRLSSNFHVLYIGSVNGRRSQFAGILEPFGHSVIHADRWQNLTRHFDERMDAIVVDRVAQTSIFDHEEDSIYTLSRDLEIPFLAVIDSLYKDKGEVYTQGFADYLTIPFIFAEINARLQFSRWLRRDRMIDKQIYANKALDLACRILLADLAYNAGTDELARRVGSNRNSLTNAFRSEFGVGPMTWHRRERLKQAAHYLEFSHLSVREISHLVGYDDSNTFSTAFKRHYEVSPLGFRKKVRNSKKSVTR